MRVIKKIVEKETNVGRKKYVNFYVETEQGNLIPIEPKGFKSPVTGKYDNSKAWIALNTIASEAK